MKCLLLTARGLSRATNEDGCGIMFGGTRPGPGGARELTSHPSAARTGQIVLKGCEFEAVITEITTPCACLISDGMGGMGAGDIATSTTLEVFCNTRDTLLPAGNLPNPDQTREFFSRAHALMLEDNEHPTMGAAIAGFCLDNEKNYIVFHAGDARIGRIRLGPLEPLTRDHAGPVAGSLGNCLGGGLPPERAFLETRFPGANTLLPGQRLVALTDGLYGPLGQDELDRLTSLHLEEIPGQARSLVEANGAPDNYSLIIVEG